MTASSPLIVEADGGSRGNPGVAGYGAIVTDPASGRLLAERAKPLGQASNNVAEYEGLIAGLQAVVDLGLGRPVLVRMDSKLVVEQMSGRWKIKHQDMRHRALRARDLAQEIERGGGSVAYEWIPRADNAHADALSNKGMDGETIAVDYADAEAGSPEAGNPEAARRPTDESAAASATARSGGQPQQTRPQPSTPLADLIVSDESTPTLEGSARLILVRHGVTAHTTSHALDGRGGSDPDLTEHGRRQAQAAAGAVKALVQRSQQGPVHVITSSLSRARETGEAVASSLGVQTQQDRDWDEQGFGDWDGLTIGELMERDPQGLAQMREDLDYTRPGGESHTQLDARVREALARAIAVGGTVVVATHRKPIMCVLSTVLGISHERVWSLATAPASLTALEVWPDGGVQVAFVNDTHHLWDL